MLSFIRRVLGLYPKFSSRMLQTEGIVGDDVLRFQKHFNRYAKKYGIYILDTGKYDDQTRRAVSDYQYYALGVAQADGFVGPQTAKSLNIKLV